MLAPHAQSCGYPCWRDRNVASGWFSESVVTVALRQGVVVFVLLLGPYSVRDYISIRPRQLVQGDLGQILEFGQLSKHVQRLSRSPVPPPFPFHVPKSGRLH